MTFHPQVVIEDDPIIKEEVEEPKCEAEVEEIIARASRVGGGDDEDGEEEDDPITRVGGSSLNFTSGLNSEDGAGEGGSSDGGGSGGGGVTLYDHHLVPAASTATHPNSGVLQDLMVSGIAGPSVPAVSVGQGRAHVWLASKCVCLMPIHILHCFSFFFPLPH